MTGKEDPGWEDLEQSLIADDSETVVTGKEDPGREDLGESLIADDSEAVVREGCGLASTVAVLLAGVTFVVELVRFDWEQLECSGMKLDSGMK